MAVQTDRAERSRRSHDQIASDTGPRTRCARQRVHRPSAGRQMTHRAHREHKHARDGSPHSEPHAHRTKARGLVIVIDGRRDAGLRRHLGRGGHASHRRAGPADRGRKRRRGSVTLEADVGAGAGHARLERLDGGDHLLPQRFDRRSAQHRVVDRGLPQCVEERGAHLGRRRKRGVAHVVQDAMDGRCPERVQACQHLVEDNGRRMDIGREADGRRSSDLLRAHVRRGPHRDTGPRRAG